MKLSAIVASKIVIFVLNCHEIYQPNKKIRAESCAKRTATSLLLLNHSHLRNTYPFIGHLNEDIAWGYFQQDGAAAHRAYVSMAILRDVFGERLFLRCICPPRSPDLSIPDF